VEILEHILNFAGLRILSIYQRLAEKKTDHNIWGFAIISKNQQYLS
jgi:hypothetical protein